MVELPCRGFIDYLKTYRGTIELARGACSADESLAPPGDVPEEPIEITLKSRPAS